MRVGDKGVKGEIKKEWEREEWKRKRGRGGRMGDEGRKVGGREAAKEGERGISVR